MGKYLVISFLIVSVALPLRAQESTDPGIKLGGYLQIDERVRLTQDNDLTGHEYRFDLKAETKTTEKAHFYSELWLRSWGTSTVQNSSDLTDKDKVSPWGLDLREAYVDLYGFLLDNLDLRIGRQRIAWGTADKLNPTDNLNADDLEDIWDYGRHLGSDGLKTSCYIQDYTITLACIPVFTPAVLPKGDLAAALSPSMALPAGMAIRNNANAIILPENNISESPSIGIKVANSFAGYDLSLSYVYGRDDLPLARKVTFTTTATPGLVDLDTELIYPRLHIAGIDMAGAIGDVGIWAEAAAFFPEKIYLETDLSALGMGTISSIAMDDNPYTKYVIGGDYTFKNGLYINGQYLHGFIYERGKDSLEDYFMFGLEQKFFDDKLKVTPIGGGIEIKDFEDLKNNYALIFAPEIAYYPVDNAEIILGLRLIDGKTATTFGRIKDADEGFIKVKYSF